MNVIKICSEEFRESGVNNCYVDSVNMKSFNISDVTSEETRREIFYNFSSDNLNSFKSMKKQVGVPIFLTVIQFFIKTYQLNYIYCSVFSDKPWQQLLTVWFNNLFYQLSLFQIRFRVRAKLCHFCLDLLPNTMSLPDCTPTPIFG